MIKSEDIFRSELAILEERCFPYQEIYFESASSGSGLKKFIQGIKDLLLKAIDSVMMKVSKTYKEEKTKESLTKLRAYCLNQKVKGAKTIRCYDVIAYQKVLKDSVNHLDKVVNKYLKGYQSSGKGLRATDKMVDDVNKTIKENDKKLAEIKSKKVEMDLQKMLDWVNGQVRKGNKQLFDFAYEYLDKLDQYAKIAADFDEKAEDYAKKNGMVRRPKGVTQSLTNASSYIRRNIDWIGAFGIAFASICTKHMAELASEDKNLENISSAEDEDWGDRGSGSAVKNPQANLKKAKLMTKENRGERHRHNLSVGAKIVQGTAVAAGSGKFLQAKAERRNSV